MPAISTTSASTHFPATSYSLRLSTALNISTPTSFSHLNTNGTDVTYGLYGAENASDTLATMPSNAQETTIASQNTLLKEESQLGTGHKYAVTFILMSCLTVILTLVLVVLYIETPINKFYINLNFIKIIITLIMKYSEEDYNLLYRPDLGQSSATA